MATVRIWDLPTRIFHWLLVACVIGLIVTGNIGGNAMVWHFRLGQTVLTLLLFRLLWGFAGGHWSRWAQLPLAPQQLVAYWRGRSSTTVWAGHNPMGSWSVLLMLLWLLLQVGTGLVSDDEIANAGPLTTLAPGAVVNAATAWHKGIGKLVLIALVLTHVGAIVWYRVRKAQALVPPMLHGNKTLAQAAPASRDGLPQRALALLLLLACALAVNWLTGLGGA